MTGSATTITCARNRAGVIVVGKAGVAVALELATAVAVDDRLFTGGGEATT